MTYVWDRFIHYSTHTGFFLWADVCLPFSPLQPLCLRQYVVLVRVWSPQLVWQITWSVTRHQTQSLNVWRKIVIDGLTTGFAVKTEDHFQFSVEACPLDRFNINNSHKLSWHFPLIWGNIALLVVLHFFPFVGHYSYFSRDPSRLLVC